MSWQLGITYKSAWFMAHRIRYAMTQPALAAKLSGIVEADETYIGGKAKGKRGRGAANKTPVVTLVERGGEARSKVVKRITGKDIDSLLRANVDLRSALMTDSFPVYQKPGRRFAKHETVNHGAGEYVRGSAHVNTAEGFFSQLKRSIDGTFHHVSEKYLPLYLARFDYLYSTRRTLDAARTERAIQTTAGKRLFYRLPKGGEV